MSSRSGAEPFFRRFIDGEVADPGQGTEVINALSATSREEVDQLLARALEAGLSESADPGAEAPTAPV